MYRRPRSLEVLLDIRTAMSEECGYDVATFVDLVRNGELSSAIARTVTREEGSLCDEPRSEIVAERERVDVSDD